jgi:glycosyltransferase involved in cell wall biosynthesis
MLLNKAYYFMKPVLPLPLRLAMRRLQARLKWPSVRDIWPIDPKAGVTPPNWPGWPGGKSFALVLTHDVEARKGLSRVEKLAELETRCGFYSSFNFVPEGDYQVPDSLRRKLDQAGFEVGVHGLYHDGKLYNSKAGFAARAARIRDYLKEWDAVGFRSPLMQHKLSWLHQLNVEYDCSTFDTDPFEPEPDAAGTIFPFWVASPNGDGYVELPYTLPQDFSLFRVLGEKTIDIWKAKLDWIAAHGGMALINTHPDYMCFDEQKPSADEYPLSFYQEFLSYVREKYEGEYWMARPRDVARYYCSSLAPDLRNSKKKICMVTHSSYESDNRVRRYAEALAKRGDHVDVIALSGGDVQLGSEEISGVTVYRVQRRDRNEKGKWTFAWRLFRFLVVSSVFLTRRHARLRYDLVHVHNVPDFLVFSAWYPKLTGSKLILDIHDIVPELFASKFNEDSKNGYVEVLKRVEKASASFVDHVIVSNHLWKDKLIARSAPEQKCSVFINHVDTAIFFQRSRFRTDGKFIILFPGSFQWHQGLDIAIEAFALIKDRVPNAEFHIYGGGGSESDLGELTRRLGLQERVKFCGSRSLDEIANVIANADLGVVPKRADSFGNEAYSTKIMEFMSQGVPVVASRTKIDTFYFDEREVRFFPSGDISSMADTMLEVIESEDLRRSLIDAGLGYVERNGWDLKKKEYLDLVDLLTVEQFGNSLPSRNVAVEVG